MSPIVHGFPCATHFGGKAEFEPATAGDVLAAGGDEAVAADDVETEGSGGVAAAGGTDGCPPHAAVIAMTVKVSILVNVMRRNVHEARVVA